MARIVKYTLVVPEVNSLDVLKVMLEIREKLGQEATSLSVSQPQTVAGDGLPAARTGGGGGRAVLYKVVDKAMKLPPQVENVRVAILSAQGRKRVSFAGISAADIITATGLRQKQVESALHWGRTNGAFESVAVKDDSETAGE